MGNKQLDVSGPDAGTHEYLIQLVALLGIAVLLSSGVWYLIMEALEGGMSGWGTEFIAGTIELAGISALLFFLVIPETMKTLREMGYLKSQSGLSGLNLVVFQIIRNSILSIMIAFVLILGVVLATMEIWEKSKAGAGAFVFGAFTLLLLAFRPTFIGMAEKFSDAKSQLKNGKKVFL